MSETHSYLNLEAIRVNENIAARNFWADMMGDAQLLPYFDGCSKSVADTGFQQEYCSFEGQIPASLCVKINKIAGSPGAKHVLLLSALGALTCKFSSANDVIIFTADPNLIDTTGDLKHALPLRFNDISTRSFREILLSCSERFTGAITNTDYPIEKKLNLETGSSLNTTFTGMIKDGEPAQKVFDELKVGFLLKYHAEDNSLLSVRYSKTLFSSTHISLLFTSYLRLLDIIVTDISGSLSDVHITTETETNKLLGLFDNRNADYPSSATVAALIEKQALLLPDRDAVSFEGRSLTYSELNAKANQLAYLLRENDVTNNSIVGLLMDRSLEMLVAMLGIIKAGGAYLPIDPDYPAERKEYLVDDSKTSLIVTTREWSAGISRQELLLYMEETDMSVYPEMNIDPVNSPSDLCYIIYTSGTTGNPKGVMIEHRNVVRLFFNSRFQFDFSERDVWTMFHSHCFDFSVWEIFGALFFGGRLIIIPKMLARDTRTFLHLLKEEQVTVLNQTPAAFYNLIQEEISGSTTGLSLRYVIFGGEALSPAKLKEWWKRYPLTRLINMFGITETTVHVTYKEIGEYEINNNISNIGTPIPTLSVYILDKYLKVVPEGCIGELFVGGEGVARGYLGKEELTRQKFISHPYRPEERIYRSGDMARILPGGDMEYLGRIDEQVKIRGYRIELGEIEYQLNSCDGVQESVVTAREEGGQKYLVGYYVSGSVIEASQLREYLLSRLPDYMVPSFFVHLTAMPLTSNGKLDRRSLPAPQQSPDREYVAPSGEVEELLCATWEKVLGSGRIGVTDNFFSSGGDSIKSIQIISRLRGHGYVVTVKDIFTQQTVRSLAGVVKRQTVESDQSEIKGSCALSPIQRWFFSAEGRVWNHYNQSVLLSFSKGLEGSVTERIFSKLQEHHDALRMVFKQGEQGWTGETLGIKETKLWLKEYDLRGSAQDEQAIERCCNEVQGSIELEEGPLLRLGLIQLESGSRLLIVIHHLVVDGISWRILFEDIETLLTQVEKGEPLLLPAKTDSFHKWCSMFDNYTRTDTYKTSRKYWGSFAQHNVAEKLPTDTGNPPGKQLNKQSAVFSLTKEQTENLLKKAHSAFGTQTDDLLLTALLLCVVQQYQLKGILVDMEGHGREGIFENTDVSRTIGWFTSIYPVLLTAGVTGENLSEKIKRIKESLRSIPNKGVDYLPARFIDKASEVAAIRADICYNYLGQFDSDVSSGKLHFATESSGDNQSPESTVPYQWEISSLVSGGVLQVVLGYSEQQYAKSTIETVMKEYKESLVELIDFCVQQERKTFTPSDLSYKELTLAELDSLQEKYPVEDIYPLSPMQEGLFFHALIDRESAAYFEQITFRWEGELVLDAVEKSLQALSDRYTVLRTCFLTLGSHRPLQIVQTTARLSCTFKDVRTGSKNQDRVALISRYREADKQQKFNLDEAGLMRLLILRTGDAEYEFIWSHHHIIMDGWCMSLIINDFGKIYQQEIAGGPLALEEVKDYSGYINWLETRNHTEAVSYWKTYLGGYDKVAVLPASDTANDNAGSANHNTSRYKLGKDQSERIREFCAQYAVTPNTIIQTVWGILLSKYNNVRDAVFGVVVSGRPGEIEGIENMVGLFINTIPVRIRYDEHDTTAALLLKVRQDALQSEPFHYQSLAEIKNLSDAGRDLVNHIVVFENYPVEEQVVAGTTGLENYYSISNVEISEQTNYDLTVLVTPGTEFVFDFKYNTGVYSEAVIQRLIAHLHNILSQVLQDPGKKLNDIVLITKEERRLLLSDFNDTVAAFPDDKTIIDLFEAQAQRIPGHIAVSDGDSGISYRDLSIQSGNIATYLNRVAGVSQGEMVGILLTRDKYLIPSIFGILKAGAAYVPVDPLFPEARINAIISNAGLKTIITISAYKELLEQHDLTVICIDQQWEQVQEQVADDLAVNAPVNVNSPAYVIFTSGSTGVPKGVVIEHRSLVNRINWMQKKYPLSDRDVLLQKTPLIFDVSVWELFWWSVAGASLSLLKPGAEKYPAEIAHTIKKEKVSVIHFVPSMLDAFLSGLHSGYDTGELKSLHTVFVSGEALRTEQVNIFGQTLHRENNTRLVNLYGPTEATVDVSYYDCLFPDTHKIIPIGKPIDNTTLVICDKNRHLMPIGIPGELCIAGVGLARGYLNNHDLTVSKFAHFPELDDMRCYHTGDLARWLPDGNIEFLGRIDHQVKIRGFRIEMEEIEFQLNLLPEIKGSVIVARENDGDKFLCAYYLSEKEQDTGQLKKNLLKVLPSYMVPAFFVHLNEFPLTLSGKLNRNALPDPVMPAVTNMQPPLNEQEKELAAIWSKVLKIEEGQISVHANFFDVGGNSIKILSLTNLINTAFNVSVSPADVFRYPTVSAFISFLNGGESDMKTYQEQISREADEMNEAINLFSNS